MAAQLVSQLVPVVVTAWTAVVNFSPWAYEVRLLLRTLKFSISRWIGCFYRLPKPRNNATSDNCMHGSTTIDAIKWQFRRSILRALYQVGYSCSLNNYQLLKIGRIVPWNCYHLEAAYFQTSPVLKVCDMTLELILKKRQTLGCLR